MHGFSSDDEARATDFLCLWKRCKAVFTKKARLIDHIRNVHFPTINDRGDGDRHLECHWLGCQVAPAPFRNSDALKQHLLYQHGSRRPFICSEDGCTSSFCSFAELTRHLLSCTWALKRKKMRENDRRASTSGESTMPSCNGGGNLANLEDGLHQPLQFRPVLPPSTLRQPLFDVPTRHRLSVWFKRQKRHAKGCDRIVGHRLTSAGSEVMVCQQPRCVIGCSFSHKWFPVHSVKHKLNSWTETPIISLLAEVRKDYYAQM